MDDDGQGELAERLAVAESPQTIAKIFDVGLLRLIDQHITRIGFDRVVAQLRNEARLRDVEVPTPLVPFFSSLVAWKWHPLRDYTKVARNLEQRIEHQGPGLPDGLFHRQHADEMVAHPQMIAFGLDVRIDRLVIEKLCALRCSGNSPIVIVEQTAKKPKLTSMIEEFDLHEVAEL